MQSPKIIPNSIILLISHPGAGHKNKEDNIHKNEHNNECKDLENWESKYNGNGSSIFFAS